MKRDVIAGNSPKKAKMNAKIYGTKYKVIKQGG
jgi:hypothetical protein